MVMASVGTLTEHIPHVSDKMELRVSKDMLAWSEPIPVFKDGKEWGNHYIALCNREKTGQPFFIEGTKACILSNHNATDVLYHDIEFIKK